MYLILNFILQNTINVFCAMTMSFALTPKHSRFRSLALYSLIGFFIYCLKFSSFDNQPVLQLSVYLTQIVFIAFPLIAFKDPLFKKLVVFSIILLCNIISEYIGLLILNSFGSYTLALEPDTKEFFLAVILALPVQILLNLIFLFLWKYAIYKKNTLIIIFFSLIPMLQLLISSCIFAPALLTETVVNTPLLTICSLIALIAIITLLYAILRRQEKQSIQAAYMELQELYKIESEYYDSLEARHEELSKLRHDYNNQLATLYVLISSNKIEAAKELAASMKNQMK